ncbi:MAG: hypothetical protein N4A47_02795 [Clostridia bacterium]|nr:hypothetical protein [Clostridia bacterium]
MSYKKSFSLYERKHLKQFRQNINTAKNLADLHNNFSKTIYYLVSDALENEEVDDDIVRFNPESNNYFDFKDSFSSTHQDLLNFSDLENIIFRFAHATYDKYVRMKKFNDKTTSKVKRVV